MRMIFLGSPQFAVPSLEELAVSHDILAVVTQPDRPGGRKLLPKQPAVKLAANRLGLPVLQPVTTRTEEFTVELRSLHPDLLVVVAYGEILRKNLLELAPQGAINLHASLLPRYRGAAPVAWSILNGELETGATTLQINEAMDAGAILLQEQCPILATDTTETLTKRIAALGAPLLKRTVDMIERNEIIPVPQDTSCVSYAPKLKKEDGLIHWDKPALWISRQIRAFDPWPGSFSLFRGNMVKFWLADYRESETLEPPGTVVRISSQTFEIACGKRSVLEVREVQLQNRPRLKASDFLHGYRVKTGEAFSSDVS